MKRALTALALGFSLLLASGGAGYAQSLQEAHEAYDRGDYATALREFRLLAEQGNTEAHFFLGLSYRYGQGVVQDYVFSHMWLNIAAAAEGGFAADRDYVASKMTPEQLAEAQRLARECVRKQYKGC